MKLDGYEFRSEYLRELDARLRRCEVLQRAVFTVLAARGLAARHGERGAIEHCTEEDTLERWLRRAATASTVDDIFDHVAQARIETLAGAVLTVLEARGLVPNEHQRARVIACTDATKLERWLQGAATVARTGEVFAS